jgi:hypothetical protein
VFYPLICHQHGHYSKTWLRTVLIVIGRVTDKPCRR